MKSNQRQRRPLVRLRALSALMLVASALIGASATASGPAAGAAGAPAADECPPGDFTLNSGSPQLLRTYTAGGAFVSEVALSRAYGDIAWNAAGTALWGISFADDDYRLFRIDPVTGAETGVRQLDLPAPATEPWAADPVGLQTNSLSPYVDPELGPGFLLGSFMSTRVFFLPETGPADAVVWGDWPAVDGELISSAGDFITLDDGSVFGLGADRAETGGPPTRTHAFRFRADGSAAIRVGTLPTAYGAAKSGTDVMIALADGGEVRALDRDAIPTAASSAPLPTRPVVADDAVAWFGATSKQDSQNCSVAGDPVVRTETSRSRALVGVRLFDRVTISGFRVGGDSRGSATLYGPFSSRAQIRCTHAMKVETVRFTPRNGTIRTPRVRVTEPGLYTWVAGITADEFNQAASHRCGLAKETSLVKRPDNPVDVIDTGFEGRAGSDAGARTTAPTRVRLPGARLDAAVLRVGLTGTKANVPGDKRLLGWLRRSAQVGDAIGTGVVVGHVSDRHDNPGAMYHLTRAKRGQVVTIKGSDGETYRYQVAGSQLIDRSERLPSRLFSMTGRPRIQLVSCTTKVTYPNGAFHYRDNLVVTLTPLD